MKTKYPGPRYATILRLSRPNTTYGRNYVPPKYDFQLAFKDEPAATFRVPRALRKIRSMGIPKLATPRVKHAKFVRGERHHAPPYPPVCPFALTYVPTENILRMSQPKRTYVDPNERLNPYAVSKKSLRPLRPKLKRFFSRLARPRQNSNKPRPKPAEPCFVFDDLVVEFDT